MILPKVFYFFYFATIASLYPFLALYYQSIGLSGRQIGFLIGLSPVIMLVSAPLWGALADATHKHRLLLNLAIASTIVAVYFLSLARNFYLVILLVIAFASLGSPISSLVDNTVMELLGNRKDQYGKQRLWGSIGYGIAAPLIGLLIDAGGLQWCFYCYILLMASCLLSTLRFPVSHAPIAHNFWRDLPRLVSNRKWISFIGLAWIGGMTMMVINNFLFLHMNDLGASKTLMGFSSTFAIFIEIPIFFYADRLLARWKARTLLVASLWVYVIRVLGYATMRQPYLALPIQLLNGPSFSVMWASGVSYANQISPPGMGATAQSLFSATAMGFGGAVGSYLGGTLYESYGGGVMFKWIAIGLSTGILIYMLVDRTLRTTEG